MGSTGVGNPSFFHVCIILSGWSARVIVQVTVNSLILIGALIKLFSFGSSAHKRKLMSKVVYNLLSDRDLRKKLKEHGLSTSGTRQQLIKRHQEFVHMYNAQCDSLNPKSGKGGAAGKLLPSQTLCLQFPFSYLSG